VVTHLLRWCTPARPAPRRGVRKSGPAASCPRASARRGAAEETSRCSPAVHAAVMQTASAAEARRFDIGPAWFETTRLRASGAPEPQLFPRIAGPASCATAGAPPGDSRTALLPANLRSPPKTTWRGEQHQASDCSIPVARTDAVHTAWRGARGFPWLLLRRRGFSRRSQLRGAPASLDPRFPPHPPHHSWAPRRDLVRTERPSRSAEFHRRHPRHSPA
jgi:hypothetical protein